MRTPKKRELKSKIKIKWCFNISSVMRVVKAFGFHFKLLVIFTIVFIFTFLLFSNTTKQLPKKKQIKNEIYLSIFFLFVSIYIFCRSLDCIILLIPKYFDLSFVLLFAIITVCAKDIFFPKRNVAKKIRSKIKMIPLPFE